MSYVRNEFFLIFIITNIITSIKINTETQIEKNYIFWKKFKKNNYTDFFKENNSTINKEEAFGDELLTNSTTPSNATLNISKIDLKKPNNSDYNSSEIKALKKYKKHENDLNSIDKREKSNSLQHLYEVFVLI